MNLNFRLTKNDLMFYYFQSMFFTRNAYKFSIFIFLIMFTLSLISQSFPININIFIASIVIALFATLFIKIIGYVFSIIYMFFSASSKNGLLGEISVKLTEEGVTEKTMNKNISSTWQGVARVSNLGSFVVIQTSPNTCILIPKRSFTSNEKYFELYNYAKVCWKKSIK